MNRTARWSAIVALGALVAAQAQAQTADEVVEKHLTAMGGRAALGKLSTRTAAGSISISLQGTVVAGSIETYTKAPNKTRSLIKLDLTQVGGSGEMVIDRRCDGKTAFESNSVQGDREITGDQLQVMLNASFPTPLLTYKDAGAKVELAGKDTVGGRPVLVLLYTPKAGPASRMFFDAETYLLVRSVTKLDTPAAGVIEQTSDLGDYRAVDGVKVPFSITSSNPLQTVTTTLSKVEHNAALDDAMFARPAVK